MTAVSTNLGNFNFALQNALSAYSDEMYTNARKLSGTGIVGSNAQIDPTTETYIGQTRFFKPFSGENVNVPDLSSSTNGVRQGYTSDYLTYVKTVRTHGAREVNVQRVISQMDGLAKIARDFGEVRAQDEHESILSILKGVAASEKAAGTGFNSFGLNYTGTNSSQTDGNSNTAIGPDSDGSLSARGFYVDVNAAGEFGSAANSSTSRGLLRDAFQSNGQINGYGAVLGDRLFTALSLGFADYEPDYVYMVTSPEIMTQLRTANLVDQTTVVEGNLEFQTVFGGKFRLIMTRANQGNASGGNVNGQSTKTTFLVKPGSIEMAMLDVPMPVEMYRDANAYHGSGSTDIWYRWGYVMHPMGYDWARSSNSAFATGSDYETAANWTRKFDYLNMGILPIFHG